MTGYRVVGIDPALTHTGLVVVESNRPGSYRVVASETLKPRTAWDLLDRLNALRIGVGSFLFRHTDVLNVVVENPTSNAGTAASTKRQHPHSIGVTGQAVGAVLATVLENRDRQDVAFLTPDDWMPKTTAGNFTHILAKPVLTRYLMGQIAFVGGESEHEIMAAGVARYWIESQRINAKLVRTPA